MTLEDLKMYLDQMVSLEMSRTKSSVWIPDGNKVYFKPSDRSFNYCHISSAKPHEDAKYICFMQNNYHLFKRMLLEGVMFREKQFLKRKLMEAVCMGPASGMIERVDKVLSEVL